MVAFAYSVSTWLDRFSRAVEVSISTDDFAELIDVATDQLRMELTGGSLGGPCVLRRAAMIGARPKEVTVLP